MTTESSSNGSETGKPGNQDSGRVGSRGDRSRGDRSRGDRSKDDGSKGDGSGHPDQIDTPGILDVTQDASTLDQGQLESGIITLVDRLSSVTFNLLILIGEFDARGLWAASGALSCVSWLTATCDIEAVTARNQVRVARAIRDYPALREAMSSRLISYSKARVLVAHLDRTNVHDLVGIASTTSSARLATAIAAWSHANESHEVIDARHRRERYVSWRTDADGMVTITARLPPSEAAVVCAAIEAERTSACDDPNDAVNSTDPATTPSTNPTDRPCDAPMGAGGDPDVVALNEHRNRKIRQSLGHQRADAVVRIGDEVLSGSVGLGPSRRSTTEIVVHVRGDGNSLDDGTPLTDNAVARLLPDGFVSLLIHDSSRKPVDASPRRRFPTSRQRRVIDEMYPQCAHPGCTARVSLQYDHIVPYAFGGPTTIDNLQKLCGIHNRAKEPSEIQRRGDKAS